MGVADPLFAAVRLYAVKRPGAGALQPLTGRIRSLGACALPIDFRVWQTDQLKGRVILEGMPDPGPGGHTARARDLRTTTYSIRRNLVSPRRAAALRQAGEAIGTPGWAPAKAIPCGTVLSHHARPGAASPVRARRVSGQAIILGGLTVRSAAASRLYGAQELEPAGRLRTVRITEAMASGDGMLRVRRRYLVYAGGRVRRQFAFDEMAVRGKLGLKPLVVTPAGEILAMGNLTGEDRFSLMSCGRLTAPEGLCGPVPDAPKARTAANLTQRGEPGAVTAAGLFARVRPAANMAWQADASALPADCRGAEGCAVRGQDAPFVALAGIRLTRGLYRRTGMPYAQAESGLDAAARFTIAARGDFKDALNHAHDGRGSLPGNLADGLTGDLGIDCSALIQMAWQSFGAGQAGRERLTTLRLQTGPIAYGCPSRVPGAGHLRAGDAIALNVTGVLEHAVLFAEPLSLDGASESWLVLEASSGCGGVCWSLYDPGVFNGWGLYRTAGRGDRPCPAAPASASLTAAPIPRDRLAWLRMLRGGT